MSILYTIRAKRVWLQQISHSKQWRNSIITRNIKTIFTIQCVNIISPELRYGHLCGSLEAKLVIFGPTDFLFGLPINLNINAGQNKFEVDILNNVAKIANLRLKIGQIPLLSLDINGHNSVIFHPIFTFFILNCLCFHDKSNSFNIKALALFVKMLVFGPIFAARPHMGKIVHMDPKPPLKRRDVSWPSPSTHVSKSKFPKL